MTTVSAQVVSSFSSAMLKLDEFCDQFGGLVPETSLMPLCCPFFTPASVNVALPGEETLTPSSGRPLHFNCHNFVFSGCDAAVANLNIRKNKFMPPPSPMPLGNWNLALSNTGPCLYGSPGDGFLLLSPSDILGHSPTAKTAGSSSAAGRLVPRA